MNVVFLMLHVLTCVVAHMSIHSEGDDTRHRALVIDCYLELKITADRDLLIQDDLHLNVISLHILPIGVGSGAKRNGSFNRIALLNRS